MGHDLGSLRGLFGSLPALVGTPRKRAGALKAASAPSGFIDGGLFCGFGFLRMGGTSVAEITKDSVRDLVELEDDQGVLRFFDEDPDRVRRYLTRLSYAPDDPVRKRAVNSIRLLSQERSASMPEFFRETIRRHIWAMNEEGGNIDWSAPEIIGAVIAGNPEMFGGFFSFAYVAAVDEPTFQPSLVRAFDLVFDAAPELVAEYTARIDELRGDPKP